MPELQHVWDETVADDDDFYPSPFFYDLARGLVLLAEQAQHTPESEARDALKRAYGYFEQGLALPDVSGVPAVIRMSLGDWLSRQASNPELYSILCADMGPRLRAVLWTSPNDSPAAETTASVTQAQSPLAVPTSPPPELEVILAEEWTYFLTQLVGTNRYFLEVFCGRAGLYVITIEFTEDERLQYETTGEAMVLSLVRSIQADNSGWTQRKVHLPAHWKRRTLPVSEPSL